MSDISIYRRYAGAMVSIARDKGKGEAWLAQLHTVLAAFREVRGLRAILENRFVDLKKRKQIVDEIGKSMSLDKEIMSFTKLLIDRKRLAMLAGIVEVFEDEVDRDAGRVAVEVRSAKSLSTEVLEGLKTLLRTKVGGEPKLLPKTDARLIDGFQLAWSGRLYDGSVRGHLMALGQKLTKSL